MEKQDFIKVRSNGRTYYLNLAASSLKVLPDGSGIITCEDTAVAISKKKVAQLQNLFKS